MSQSRLNRMSTWGQAVNQCCYCCQWYDDIDDD